MNRKRLGSLAVGLALAWLTGTLWLVMQGQRTASASLLADDLRTLQREAAVSGAAADRSAAQTDPERYRILLGRVMIPVPTATPIPQPTPDGTRREAQIPILMYHYVDVPGPNADAIRRDLSVPPEAFETHLARIQALGYQTITMKKLVQHLALGAPLPDKPIVLTFDDGYVDHYTEVFPRLKARGMVGSFYVISDYPHSGNNAYMTWDMIREMQAWGMEMEAHSNANASLAGRTEAYLRTVIQSTAQRFEQELGITPRIITYPMGRYDDNTMRVFRDAGYWAGLTTKSGVLHSNGDMFQLHRVRIHGHTNADQVEWLLSEAGLKQLRSYQ